MPSCQEAGVLGVVPGIIGSIQAAEALKLLLGIGETLSGRLLVFDALHMSFMDVAMKRNTACPACGEYPTITELDDYGQDRSEASCTTSTQSETERVTGTERTPA
jgi:adenylyltransferase/sulfurtransferase